MANRNPTPCRKRTCRARAGALPAALAALLLCLPPGCASDPLPARDADGAACSRWVGTWSSSPQEPFPVKFQGPYRFRDETLRQVAHVSLGGDRLRVRLSNRFGPEPLVIDAASVGIRSRGAQVLPGSLRALTFGGDPSVTVAPGARVLSDPVELSVPDEADLSVSLYLARETRPATVHLNALETTCVSPAGDHTAREDMPVAQESIHGFWLSGIEVLAPAGARVVVALGDSITDGYGSTPGASAAYPARLAHRLLSARDPGEPGTAVLNGGIGGNRLLRDVIGPNAQERLDRDVLTQSGATHLILLEGTNDMGMSALGLPPDVTAGEIIQACRQIIRRAAAQGFTVLGGTLLPYEGAFYHSEAGERTREAVNAWIRTSGAFDAVIDFDAVMRDPAHPARMLPRYDSGDHLHPGDAGYEAMAAAAERALRPLLLPAP